MDFTLIDGAVLAVIGISAILAYARGFIREVLAIGGWIGSAMIAFYLADTMRPLVRQIPVVQDFLDGSCQLSMLAAFVAAFALSLIAMSLLVPVLSSVLNASHMNGPDRILGLFFGFLRGVLLVAVAFFVYYTVMDGQFSDVVEGSLSAQTFREYLENNDGPQTEEFMEWLIVQYDVLLGPCNAPK